jgi:hypothetical protein
MDANLGIRWARRTPAVTYLRRGRCQVCAILITRPSSAGPDRARNADAFASCQTVADGLTTHGDLTMAQPRSTYQAPFPTFDKLTPDRFRWPGDVCGPHAPRFQHPPAT